MNANLIDSVGKLSERYTRDTLMAELSFVTDYLTTLYLERERDEEERKEMVACIDTLKSIKDCL